MRNLLPMLLMATAANAETGQWLTSADITYMLVGRDISGFYQNGARFSETYRRVGKIEYRDDASRLQGSWSQKGDQFCTLYDKSPGGCYRMKLLGPNCFEYWLVDEKGAMASSWIARGWQVKYTPTCPAT